MTRYLRQGLQNNLCSLLSESDMSFEEIIQCLHVSKSTVSRYCNTWGIVRPINLDGRPAVLSETSKSLMKRMVLTGKLKPGVEVYKHFMVLYPSLTYFTTLNALKTMCFKSRPKKKVPFLSKKHREEHLNWALAHRSWTMHD